MSNEEVLYKLDEMIERLTKQTGVTRWEIRLRKELAKKLFGDPLPTMYTNCFITIDDNLMEFETDEGFKSDIWIIQQRG